MAFPNEIVTFPQLVDITETDAVLVAQYQQAMQTGNIALAKSILDQIPAGQNKIVNADYFNKINNTLNEVQQYFADRYSPAYIVSREQPTNQEATDFWFQVTD